MTTNHRTDAKKFAHAAEKATGLLTDLHKVLDGMTIHLTEKDRTRISKPSASFELIARPFAKALLAPENRKLCTFAEIDPEAIIEDLDNLSTLTVLQTRVDALRQRLADTELVWRGEVDVDVRAAYEAGKMRAKTEGEVGQLIAPLAEHYAAARRAKEPKQPE